jgi:hypothetical protein
MLDFGQCRLLLAKSRDCHTEIDSFLDQYRGQALGIWLGPLL